MPGDVVSVTDTLGMIANFAGTGGPTKAATDMLGVGLTSEPRLDGKITVIDLVATLGAFGGSNYVFTDSAVGPPPGACPP